MNKWDSRFLKLAREVSKWSKDPSTQVGAIAVKDRQILATGYNGFPKGIEDKEQTLNNRESKLRLKVHGEMNMKLKKKNTDMYMFSVAGCGLVGYMQYLLAGRMLKAVNHL